MGPTASGKTALACNLADRFPLDHHQCRFRARLSRTRYRIGETGRVDTAKIPASTHRYPRTVRSQIRRLIFVMMRYVRWRSIYKRRHRVPILDRRNRTCICARLQCGTFGSCRKPIGNCVGDCSEQGAAIGWAAMHARIGGSRSSPPRQRIGPADAQRIQRALEVIELTGESMSSLQSSLPKPFPYRVLKLALIPDDRVALHARIAERFDAMLSVGFVDEVSRLRAREELHSDLPAMRAVGYRQAWQHLDGEFDAAELRNRGIFATRQLAKRQLTWLRSELDARVIDPDAARFADITAVAISDFLHTFR